MPPLAGSLSYCPVALSVSASDRTLAASSVSSPARHASWFSSARFSAFSPGVRFASVYPALSISARIASYRFSFGRRIMPSPHVPSAFPYILSPLYTGTDTSFGLVVAAIQSYPMCSFSASLFPPRPTAIVALHRTENSWNNLLDTVQRACYTMFNRI